MASNEFCLMIALQVCSFVGRTLSEGCLEQDTFNAQDKLRSFSSNSEDQYSNDIECVYKITTSKAESYGIFISWTSFDVIGDMPYCKDGDYVEVFSGCGSLPNSLGKFCSKNSYKPHDIYTDVGCVQLKFYTNSETTGTGFKFTYKRYSLNTILSPNMWCSSSTDKRDGRSGVIYSPNWPSEYPARQSCLWEISVGSQRHVKITFMFFDLHTANPCRDYVVVRGGKTGGSFGDSSLIKRNSCGKQSPFSIYTDYQKVYIQFKTATQLKYKNKGFVAGYVLYDSGMDKDSGSHAGIIAGAVFGCLLVIGVTGVVLFTCRKRRAAKRASAQTHQPNVVSSGTPSGSTTTGTSSEPSAFGGSGYPPKPQFARSNQYAASSQSVPMRQPSFTNYPSTQQGRYPPSPVGRPGIGENNPDGIDYQPVARATIPAGVRMQVLAEEYAPPPYQLATMGANQQPMSPFGSSNSSHARSRTDSEDSFTEETSNKSL